MTIEAVLPALPLQVAIARLRTADPRSRRYVDSRTYRVTPALEPHGVAAAWSTLHRRWQALRSRLVEHNGSWLLVVDDEPKVTNFEGLNVSGVDDRQQQRILRDLDSRLADQVLAGAPAALGLLNADRHTVLTLTWLHELLDGPAVTTLLNELRQLCEGDEVRSSAPVPLVDVTRELQTLVPIELPQSLGSPPRDLCGFPGRRSDAIATTTHSLDGAALVRIAADAGSTAAVVAIAACVSALAAAVPAGGFLLTAEDLRPPRRHGVPGMFSGVAATWHPGGALTFRELVRVIHLGRGAVAGRRPVSLTDLLRPLRAAGVAGMPDVLLTVHRPIPPDTAERHRWQILSAFEATEFAVSLDLVLDEDASLHIHADPARVPDVGPPLTDHIMQALAAPTRTFVQPGVDLGAAAPRAVGGAGDGETRTVVAVCARALAMPDLESDTDLTGLDVGSLDLMRLAVALSEAGLPVSVSDIFQRRTPRGLAARLAGPATSDAMTVTATSALERSLLQRTEKHRLGRQPMHEQSIIVVATYLDVARFARAVAHVGRTTGVVNTRWAASPEWTLAADPVGPPIHAVDVPSVSDLDPAARKILASDLARGFGPGDLLYRCWLVRAPAATAIVASWHNAILDGWSTATLMRSIQDAYMADDAGLLPPPAFGASIDEFRRWSASRAGDSAAVWAHYLAGTSTFRFNQLGPVLDRRRSAPKPAGRLEQFTKHVDPRTTLNSSVLALAGRAFQEVLDLPEHEPIGVRVGLRPATIPGSLRMAGQATLEAPLRFDFTTDQDAAASIQTAINMARENGHIGEAGIREAVRCPPDEELFRLLLVTESDLPEDEWMMRTSSVRAWRELSMWRREVSPSVVTAYVHTGGERLVIEVSTTQDDPDRIGAAVATILGGRA
ncbi:condensation domain-containing protein [Dactylosporangium sp. NPDC050588]|uniref:condensation domain-containing protein n=1 Tax=Dactylosporangium sp. NPDC050588 TaxID=3157211 RepID=UPI0033DAAC57